MSYQFALPQAFPWVAVGTPDDIRLCVTELLDPGRDDVPFGSSFAVTVERTDGWWSLWLSEASRSYLKSLAADKQLSVGVLLLPTERR